MDNQAKNAASAQFASPLQIDQAMMSLHDAVTANTEAVRTLLDRLSPVSQRGLIAGSLTITGGGIVFGAAAIGKEFQLSKAPLAEAIEARRTAIAELTKEVQSATAALQI